jgi:hypothetical protein
MTHIGFSHDCDGQQKQYTLTLFMKVPMAEYYVPIMQTYIINIMFQSITLTYIIIQMYIISIMSQPIQ